MSYRYPRPPKRQIAVKRGISGLGLFAREPIQKNEFVIEYFGLILDDKKANERGGKYLFSIDKNKNIDGSARENKARYLNHSCRPNCEAEIDGQRVFIYAKKNISAGQELTYNYGKEYFEDYIKPNGCRCGHH